MPRLTLSRRLGPLRRPARAGRPRRDASIIATGDFVVLVGRSGCGKTSLLNVAAGFLAAGAGQRHDRRPAGHRRPAPDRAVVFQNDALFPWLASRENVAFALRLRGVPTRRAPRRADELLALVQLDGAGDKPHLGALRRHAPARRPGAGARRRARLPADGRAARRARRADARADADDCCSTSGRQRPRRADGHPRHRGGAAARHPHRRHGPEARAGSCGPSRPASAGATRRGEPIAAIKADPAFAAPRARTRRRDLRRRGGMTLSPDRRTARLQGATGRGLSVPWPRPRAGSAAG